MKATHSTYTKMRTFAGTLGGGLGFLLGLSLSLHAQDMATVKETMKETMKKTSANPLMLPFDTPYGAIPFAKIRTEHYMPAFEAAMKDAKADIQSIAEASSPATFENTVLTLGDATAQVELLSNVFFSMQSARSDDEMRKVAETLSPQLASFQNDIVLNQALFSRIKAIYERAGKQSLDAPSQRLLEKTYRYFVRNGANLNTADKEKLRAMDDRFAVLIQNFGKNALKATEAYELHLTAETDIAGVPEAVVETAAKRAREKEKKGWIFTLRAPSFRPFMTYAASRPLRQQLYRAYASRAVGGEYSNLEVIKEIVALRHQRALLLGYAHHAAYVLEERMAKDATNVQDFLRKISEKALPYAKKEVAELETYAKKQDGIDKLERWDVLYYIEKLKKEKYAVDDELLRPYFPSESVIAGIFKVSEKLYGLRFQETKKVDPYHEDVKTYEVYDEEGRFVSLLYVDLFSREGKRNGAWMTSFKDQHYKGQEDKRPHVSFVCNFPRGTATRPSLLSFGEVETVFHEFGHVLHGMLSNVPYRDLSGTNVTRDFVEMPSHLMENWIYEKACLDLFAAHYQTKEPIPAQYIARIRDLQRFMAGYYTVRQLTFGTLDMATHTSTTAIEDVVAFEKKAVAHLDLFPPVEGTAISCAFSHIYSGQGDYSAGYYSYKWAEMIEADAFELFKEKGIFDKETARRFRDQVLSKGDLEDPDALYRKFRGQDPDPFAFLRRAGLN